MRIACVVVSLVTAGCNSPLFNPLPEPARPSGVLAVPGFALEAGHASAEDAGPQSAAGFATDIVVGEGGSSVAQLRFLVDNNTNPNLFLVPPAIDSDGVLTYTAAADGNGTATIAVRLEDTGVLIDGVTPKSSSESFTITVTPINDPPTFVINDPPAVIEDAGLQTETGVLTDVVPGPDNESTQIITSIVAEAETPVEFAVAPAISSDGTLSYQPAADVLGDLRVTVRVSDDGGTADGGVDTASGTIHILVTADNDAPVLAGANDLPAIDEDVTDPVGVPIADLVSGQITDADAGDPAGIAVTAADNTLGVWQYSTNNGMAWTAFATLGEESATLLGATADDLVRFVPAADENGTTDLTFRAWDGSLGRASGSTGVRVSTNGGTTPYSSASATAQLVVRPVNDAPLLTGSSPLADIDEDNPTGAGTLAADLFSHTDVDLDTVGIVVIAADETNGTWEVTLDGSTWLGLGVVNASSARAVPPTGSLRFLPAADWHGDDTPGDDVALTLRLWDASAGAGGDLLDTSSTGGTTPFSSDAATVYLEVLSVNDPPTFTIGPDVVADENAGVQIHSNWATNISTGAANESQVVDFWLTPDQPALFASGPNVTPDGTLSFRPSGVGGGGVVSVEIFLRDELLADSATETFTITINNVPEPPDPRVDVAFGYTLDDAVVVPVLDNDFIDSPGGFVAAVTAPSDGAVTCEAGGAPPCAPGDGVRYDPDPAFEGLDVFTYTVEDSAAQTGTAEVMVLVTTFAGDIAVEGVSVDDSDAFVGGGGPPPPSLNSEWPSISWDGRFVAFTSERPLVVADGNTHYDIYLRDRQAGTTTLVSVNPSAQPGDATSSYSASSSAQVAVTPAGQFVAFTSRATDLVTGDTNGVADIFVRDRVAGTTERVSTSGAGAEGDGASYAPAISATGRYVAFQSAATNLHADDTDSALDVYVRDRVAGTTELISRDGAGDAAGGEKPAISADGRYVAFQSASAAYDGNDTNGTIDIFVFDRATSEHRRVSVASSGLECTGDSTAPSISVTGRYVAFLSRCTDLEPLVTHDAIDGFVHDVITGTTTWATAWVDGTDHTAHVGPKPMTVTADGTFAAFTALGAMAWVTPSTTFDQAFGRDLTTDDLDILSYVSTTIGNSFTRYAAVSADGRYVALQTFSNDLLAGMPAVTFFDNILAVPLPRATQPPDP